jgi:hypothetical protein
LDNQFAPSDHQSEPSDNWSQAWETLCEPDYTLGITWTWVQGTCRFFEWKVSKGNVMSSKGNSKFIKLP